MIKCGMCRSDSIPEEKGIHYCSNCGQGHEIVRHGELFIIHPYPREEE